MIIFPIYVKPRDKLVEDKLLSSNDSGTNRKLTSVLRELFSKRWLKEDKNYSRHDADDDFKRQIRVSWHSCTLEYIQNIKIPMRTCIQQIVTVCTKPSTRPLYDYPGLPPVTYLTIPNYIKWSLRSRYKERYSLYRVNDIYRCHRQKIPQRL